MGNHFARTGLLQRSLTSQHLILLVVLFCCFEAEFRPSQVDAAVSPDFVLFIAHSNSGPVSVSMTGPQNRFVSIEKSSTLTNWQLLSFQQLLPAKGAQQLPPSRPWEFFRARLVPTTNLVIARINSGGPAIGGFVADESYSGGSTANYPAQIDISGVTNAAPLAVYNTERWGTNFTYKVSGLRPDTQYRVLLHFCEIYFTQRGQRQFNAAIQGTQILTHFDIIAAAGASNKVIVLEFNATPDSTGKITISFSQGLANLPKLSALELIQPTPIFTAGLNPLLAINSGGSAAGNYQADTAFIGGTNASQANLIDTSGIINPGPQVLYQTERYGSFTYTFRNLTPSATYLLRLHFAEIYWSAPGMRQFNVSIQGRQVVTNFDIVSVAGGPNKAITREFIADANTNGEVRLQLEKGAADFPKLSGLELFSSSARGLGSQRIFSADSFWYRPIPLDAPLHTNSANYVIEFLRQKDTYYPSNVAINMSSYSPPVYYAQTDTPMTKVSEWNCQNKGIFPTPALIDQWNAVPVPIYAEPSDGTDAEMSILAENTLFEFWKARKTPDGHWEACWGGRMENLSDSSGIWPYPFGQTATGLPPIGGQITAEELEASSIEHVIGLSLVDLEHWNVFSWPANRSDGNNSEGKPNRIPEGLRFRCVFRRISDSKSDLIRTGIRFISDTDPI